MEIKNIVDVHNSQKIFNKQPDDSIDTVKV